MVLSDLLTVQRCSGGEDTGGGVQVEVQAGHSHLQRHCYQTILILIWVLYLDLEDKGKERRVGGKKHRDMGGVDTTFIVQAIPSSEKHL